VAVSVLVGYFDDHADWLAGPSRLSWVRRPTGQPARLVSPEDAAAYTYTPMEREVLRGVAHESSSVVGGPEKVRRELEDLAERTGAQELMVLTSTYGHKDRLRSYELLWEAFAARSNAAT
jgi:alkanesulfonate monooxygenase SsuD/methylene tetrahydromethanopterin reductase-like flavin-dependent oxidoreductase (luciferase family)